MFFVPAIVVLLSFGCVTCFIPALKAGHLYILFFTQHEQAPVTRFDILISCLNLVRNIAEETGRCYFTADKRIATQRS